MADTSSPTGQGFAREDFNLFTPIATRWSDLDSLGHINNTLYVRYLEAGRVDYFTRLLEFRFGAQDENGLILADLNISFLQQVHHPAELEVGSRVSRLGNSSFDILAAIYPAGKTNPVAVSKAVCVWFNYAENRKQPIPQSVRAKLIAHERVKPL